jgi:hypothetical protein
MSRATLTAAVAMVTFFVFARGLFELPSLPDTDSYYHLAVAQLYADHGIVKSLPWARFSAMHDGFGDKELLFHLLLMPFTSADGGRLAIALANAALAGAIAWIAIDALGAWGALLAPLLFLAAPYLWIRTIRLRPELLSVLLFLLIAHATARRKVWTVAVLSLALTLGHTAFHVLGAMAVLWLLATWLVERRWEWKPAAATFAGIAAGIVLHPHVPDNLRIWWLQNVRFLQLQNVLDVGAEIHPPRIADLLRNNAGGFVAALAALLLLRPWTRRISRTTAVFASTAAVFLVLQLLMERMSTYFFPFATLAIAFACAGLPRRRVPIAVVAVIAIFASTPFALRAAHALSLRLPSDVERDYAAFGASVPAGAKVAARWGATDAYVFFAPQGQYLDVLDPVFMAVPHPREYAAQRLIFDGLTPDIPLLAKRQLDSDFIAFAQWETPRAFSERVRNDPRLVRVYDGYNVLLRIQPTDAFVTDWPGYPLVAPGYEGFVDADRIHPGAACTTFTRTLSSSGRYELAPWGPTKVWLDGRLIVDVPSTQLAILGHGTTFDTGTASTLRIRTCRAGEHSGFYLRFGVR